MPLTHRFTVPAPLEDAWNAFRQPDVIADCVPGTTIMNADRTEVRGALKIKMGPLPLAYDGTASFREADTPTPQMLIEVNGADRRGHGTIVGTITASLAEEDSGTQVELASDLSLTGRVSQFGDGVIKEAGEKLLEQFASRLATRIAEGVAPPPPLEMVPDEAEAAAAAAAEEPTLIIERDRAEVQRAQRERARREHAEPVRDQPAAFATPRETGFDEPAPIFVRAAQAPREPYTYRPPTIEAEPHVDVLKRIAPRLIMRAGPLVLLAALIAYLIVRRRRR
jgi:carbon monoxide dehydrogenase subunit G